MTFVPSLPNRQFMSTGSYASNLSRIGRSSNISKFADSFGGIVRPSSIVSLQVNPNFNVNFGSNSNSDGGPPPSSKKPKNGNRPHKSRAYYPPKERLTSDLNFSSGIKPGMVVNLEERNSIAFSTLFVSCGSFFPSDSLNSISNTLFENDIFRDVLKDCEVFLNYKISKDFKRDDYFKYLYSLTSALQLYYYVDSIMAYTNASNAFSNLNVGLHHLRSEITADILSSHQRLDERLRTMPIPSNLLNFVRYMYQNFSLFDDVNGPVIRLGFRETLHAGNHISLSSDYYDIIIDELLDRSAMISSILLRVYPQMQVDTLPLSCETQIYDMNFLSFWTNSCITHLSKDGSVAKTRKVNDDASKFDYFVFNGDNLDGLFLSCNSIYNESRNDFHCGIWTPINDPMKFKGFFPDNCSSLLCYNSDLRKMTSPLSQSLLSQSGVFHGSYLDSSIDEYIDALLPPYGALKFQSASLDNMNQAISQSIRFLFEVPQPRRM